MRHTNLRYSVVLRERFTRFFTRSHNTVSSFFKCRQAITSEDMISNRLGPNINHPLAYGNAKSVLQSVSASHASAPFEGAEVSNGASQGTSSLSNPRHLEHRINYLYGRRRITVLLSTYSYFMDVTVVDPHLHMLPWLIFSQMIAK